MPVSLSCCELEGSPWHGPALPTSRVLSLAAHQRKQGLCEGGAWIIFSRSQGPRGQPGLGPASLWGAVREQVFQVAGDVCSRGKRPVGRGCGSGVSVLHSWSHVVVYWSVLQHLGTQGTDRDGSVVV